MGEKDNFSRKFNSSSFGGNFGTSVLIPFICGVLGALLVLGITFGVPEIRNTLFNNTTISSDTSVPTSSLGNLDQISLKNYSDTAISASNKVLPSIVGISVEFNVTSNSFLGTPQKSTATAEGSGIIMSKDGYILTNNHIISSSDSSNYYQVSEATSIKVSLYNDEEQYDAKVIGLDKETDLAVIKIEKDNLVAVELGDSSKVQIGEFVLAIGNPLGLQSSVSAGIVSAVNREVTSEDGTEYVLIQTDAAINSGNSGGALVSTKGQVIGINTLKLSGTGIEGMGFSIPINDTISIYDELRKNGKISRPYIGIAGIDIDEKTGSRYSLPVGIYVRSVENFSSAEKSGVKTGDVITSIDGKEIKTMEELNKIKKSKNIGDVLELGITRDKKQITVQLTLAEQP